MTTSRIIMEFADRPHYDVRIGTGIAAVLGRDLRAGAPQADRVVLICDSESRTRVAPVLFRSLNEAGFRVVDITIPAVDPADAWAAVAELHQAFASLNLTAGTPLVVCAGVQATDIAAFAASSYGARQPLVLVPASLACAIHNVGVDSFELDAGLEYPVRISAAPALASIDCDALACESGEEAQLGLDDLTREASFCDEDFRAWCAEQTAGLAAGDVETLTLALTQILAARADALGRDIAARLG